MTSILTGDTAEEEAPYPTCVRRRLLAVLKLQQELVETDAEFHRRLFELESEFNGRRQQIYAKRASIIHGEYEPKDEDSNIDFLPPEAVSPTKDDTEDPPVKGIPNFWREALNNSSLTGIFECDRSALQYLYDIMLDVSAETDLTFTLTFKFDPNPYFENETLTKKYYVECEIDPAQPFAYDGAQIYHSTGSEIKWRDGMDYTKDRSSFFNFFSPPSTDRAGDVDPSTFDDITADFEMGLFLKEKMIPKAALYFLSSEFDTENSDPGSDSSTTDMVNEELITDHTDQVQLHLQ